MEKLKYLLNNYMIYKNRDEDIFYEIKDNAHNYKEFLEEFLKYKLIIRPDFLKLEKSPGTPHFSMGIQCFTSVLDYIIFFKLLYFLDNMEKGKQFLFTELKDSIKLNWLDGKNRISLVRVLKFALDIPILKEIDKIEGDIEEKEMLLESLGNSRYVISSSYTHEEPEKIDLKTKIYRDLVMNNVIYSDYEKEYEYCKKYKDEIDETLNKFLNWSIQIHKNMIITVVSDTSGIFKSFPGKSDDDKIALQFNKLIRDKILNGQFLLKADDTLILEHSQVDLLIEELRDKNEKKWTKLSREKKNQNLKKDILQILEFFSFIKNEENEIKIYPLCGKVVGEYGKEEER
ncbi:MAG: DUF2398 family protein [Fusobacteriaceae bacterium]